MVGAALFINASLITAAVVNTYDPVYEWEAHELDSPQLLISDGVPEEVINKLEAHHKRLYSFEAFEEFLSTHLTDSEIKAYGDQLRKVSHDTFSNRFNQFLQWPETVDEMRKLLVEKGLSDPQFIVSREYQLSSALSFYFPNHPWPQAWKRLREISGLQRGRKSHLSSSFVLSMIVITLVESLKSNGSSTG